MNGKCGNLNPLIKETASAQHFFFCFFKRHLWTWQTGRWAALPQLDICSHISVWAAGQALLLKSSRQLALRVGSKCDLQDREQMIRLDLAVSYPPNTDRAAKRLKLNHVAFTRQLLKQLTIVQSARFQGQTWCNSTGCIGLNMYLLL